SGPRASSSSSREGERRLQPPFESRRRASSCTTSGRLCAGSTNPTPSGRSRSRLPIRSLFLLAVLAAVDGWFIERRRGGGEVSVTIGYAHGSAVTLAAG